MLLSQRTAAHLYGRTLVIDVATDSEPLAGMLDYEEAAEVRAATACGSDLASAVDQEMASAP